MPYDYDKLYQEQRHALGEPTRVFVEFFDAYDKKQADVLDIGCGQGRDALFIARLGHHVVGVDIAPAGIAQLLEDAKSEALNIEGVVADLRTYETSDQFDVIVVDRTLHMLKPSERIHVLKQISRATRAGGYVLIADEKSNIPAIKQFFADDDHNWTIQEDRHSYVSVQRDVDSDEG